MLQKQDKILNFLSQQTEHKIEEQDLETRVWKSLTTIKNPDLFHEIAQGLGITELRNSLNGLYFTARIQDTPGEAWTFSLHQYQEEEFKTKYRSHYSYKKLNAKSSNP